MTNLRKRRCDKFQGGCRNDHATSPTRGTTTRATSRQDGGLTTYFLPMMVTVGLFLGIALVHVVLVTPRSTSWMDHSRRDVVLADEGIEGPIWESSSSWEQSLLQPTTSLLLPRELKYEDLIVGEYIASGGVNTVYHVELPHWWHVQQQALLEKGLISTTSYSPQWTYVIKLALFDTKLGKLEMEVLTKLNSNPTLARNHHIIPIIYGNHSIPNPFYWKRHHRPYNNHEEEQLHQFQLPDDAYRIWNEYEEWLNTQEEVVWKDYEMMSVIVVPNEKSIGIGHHFQPMDIVMNYTTIRTFFYTTLSVLEYAHSLGIMNGDISMNNLHCDRNGKAIISDWNGHVPLGQPLYDEDMDTIITPPEAQFPTYPIVDPGSATTTTTSTSTNNSSVTSATTIVTTNHVPIVQTSIGPFDIWSTGLFFIRILLYPHCDWLSWKLSKPSKEQQESMNWYEMRTVTSKRHFRHVLSAMIMDGSTNKINTTIRLNPHGDSVDLRTYLGLVDSSTSTTSGTLDEVEKDDYYHSTNDSPWDDDTAQWKLPLCDRRAKKMLNSTSICQPCKYTTKLGKLFRLEKEQQRQDVINLIQRMMKVSPEDRATASELLRHPFFDGYSG